MLTYIKSFSFFTNRKYLLFFCRTGLYPLTGMESTKAKKENRPQLNTSRPKSPEDNSSSNQGKSEEEEHQKEVRHVRLKLLEAFIDKCY